MTRTILGFILAGLALVALAVLPTQLGAYGVGLLLGMTGYVALASAWALSPISAPCCSGRILPCARYSAP